MVEFLVHLVKLPQYLVKLGFHIQFHDITPSSGYEMQV
jgi:hypothetical protein